MAKPAVPRSSSATTLTLVSPSHLQRFSHATSRRTNRSPTTRMGVLLSPAAANSNELPYSSATTRNILQSSLTCIVNLRSTFNSIARTANSVSYGNVETLIDLVSQSASMDVYYVGLRVKAVPQDGVKQYHMATRVSSIQAHCWR